MKALRDPVRVEPVSGYPDSVPRVRQSVRSASRDGPHKKRVPRGITWW